MYVVRYYIYPALLDPPPQLNFEDHYAFRPTGSTTAALIAILHTVRSMLSTNLTLNRGKTKEMEIRAGGKRGS